MLKIKKDNHSQYLRKLPEGCKLCKKGQKIVLFTTGICPRSCFYCPLSDNRKDRDVVWANEWKTNRDEDIIKEAELIGAKGAGITGGDPLAKLDRTIHYIKLLKNHFKKFHIHLYTSPILIDKDKLDKLYRAGLDEIRLHPNLETKKDWDKIKLPKNKKRKWDVGIEIPAIPKEEATIKELIEYSKNHIDFLNLNELEISDNNANKILDYGYHTKKDSYAIRGSDTTAKKILEYCAKKNLSFSVNFCSTKVKDKEQMYNRIIRRAKSIAQPFDYVTEEGILMRGVIYPILVPGFDYKQNLEKFRTKTNIKKLDQIKEDIKKNNQIPNNLIKTDKKKLRILIAPWILEEINKEYKSAIVSEYPTYDNFEVEIEFLN